MLIAVIMTGAAYKNKFAGCRADTGSIPRTTNVNAIFYLRVSGDQ